METPHVLWHDVVLAMADDAWIIGHRGSEWLALAPDLEEDLALSSISQDEMGHAQRLYALLEEFGAPSPESQVYERPVEAWRHARLVARPLGDWADWIVRRYLFETFDAVRRNQLRHVPWPALQEALNIIEREERFHRRHFDTWMDLLAHGGSESRQRLGAAVASYWPELPDLLSWGVDPEPLGLEPNALQEQWTATVKAQWLAWDIPWPGDPVPVPGRRNGLDPEFKALLDEMRSVRQIAPLSSW